MYKLEGIQCPKFVSYIKLPSYDVLLRRRCNVETTFLCSLVSLVSVELIQQALYYWYCGVRISTQNKWGFAESELLIFLFIDSPTKYFNLIKEFKPKHFFFNHDNLPFLLESAPLAVCTKKQETTTFSNINVFITYNESCWWLSLHPMFIAMDL